MRAWAVAEALGRLYDVALFVPWPDGAPATVVMPSNVTDLSTVAGPGRPPATERIRRALRDHWPKAYSRFFRVPGDWARHPALPPQLASSRWHRVHIFRHYLAPYADQFLNIVPCHLDLDESEARTRSRIAVLYQQNGFAARARLLAAESRYFEKQEQTLSQGFERVYVASEPDRQALIGRDPNATTVLLPNTVITPATAPAEAPTGPVTLLFVGNLHYYPNEDAIRFFVERILPSVHRSRPGVHLAVVGNGPPRLKRYFARHANVGWFGFVDDLEPLYRKAHIVIAPMRAGGGTRIKILEAFSRCRAVVATRVGAEGLDVTNGTHLLEADSAAEFAACCVQLIEGPELRHRIAHAGYRLVTSRYSSLPLDTVR
jgi:glycosyltransferase involved in cell wall biosynthesis